MPTTSATTAVVARQAMHIFFRPSQYEYSHDLQHEHQLGTSHLTPHLLSDSSYSLPTSESLLASAPFNYEAPPVYVPPAEIVDWSNSQADSFIDYWSVPLENINCFDSTFDNSTPLNLSGSSDTYNTFDAHNSLTNSMQDQVSPYESQHINNSSSPPQPPPKSNTPSPQASTPTSKATPNPSSRVEKRTKNTLAARRYRQKRVDKINDLEEALNATQAERDALKVRVARLEGEAEVMRQMLRSRDR